MRGAEEVERLVVGSGVVENTRRWTPIAKEQRNIRLAESSCES